MIARLLSYGMVDQNNKSMESVLIVITIVLSLFAVEGFYKARKAKERKRERNRLALRALNPIEFEYKGKWYCSCGGRTTEINGRIDIWKEQE